MKSICKKIILGIVSLALVVGISVVFFIKRDSRDVSAAITNDNGETILKYEDKENILQNIMEKNGQVLMKLLILSKRYVRKN